MCFIFKQFKLIHVSFLHLCWQWLPPPAPICHRSRMWAICIRLGTTGLNYQTVFKEVWNSSTSVSYSINILHVDWYISMNNLPKDPEPGLSQEQDPELCPVSCSAGRRGQRNFVITQTIMFSRLTKNFSSISPISCLFLFFLGVLVSLFLLSVPTGGSYSTSNSNCQFF